MAWTLDQQRAINKRGGKILVSAAAGSGKTAVLSQRVLNYVLNGNDVDKLLIVTFTDAASVEMRTRIKKNIEDEVRKNPTDHLKRQLILIDNTKITTMDAFYNELVKQNFEKLGIKKEFSILSSFEEELIKKKVVNSLYDKKLKDKEFLSLLSFFNITDNTLITDIIYKLDNFFKTIPFYEKCMDEFIDKYNTSYYKKLLLDIIKKDFESYDKLYDDLKEELYLSSSDFDKLNNNLNEEKEFIRRVLEVSSFDDLSVILRTTNFSKLPIIKGHKDDYVYEKYKKLRTNLKDVYQKKLDDLKSVDETIFNKELLIQKDILKSLFDVVKDYRRMLIEEKIKINKFSFSDIPLFVLDLLIKDNKKTALALKIANLYDEILIDEYQDTNMLQSIIFNAISKNEGNLFVVGDIKQSIYRFRSACPDIFNSDKEKSSLDSFPMLINLSLNFRSRPSVLSFSNFIFENIMSKYLGEVTYDEKEMFYNGFFYDKKEDTITEIDIIDNNIKDNLEKEDLNDLTKQEKEAIYVANKIKYLIDSKYKVLDKKTGEYRNIEPSDIAILIRNLTNSDKYVSALLNRGIGVFCDKTLNFFDNYDVMLIISLLKVIDNYLDDVSLISVLTSDLFGVSDFEIATERAKNKNCYLYESIINGNNLKLKEIINVLDDIKSYSTKNDLVSSILYMYKKLDIINKIGTNKNKIKNLNIMIKNAEIFSETKDCMLHEFVSYIDDLIYDKSSFEGQNPMSDGKNVLITTIHKSKGLEYPVVFLPSFSSNFNKTDLTDPILMDKTYGISFDMFDKEKSCFYTPLSKMAIKEKIKILNLSEELRVLYVALTRAKEKIIITASVNNLASKLSKISYLIGNERKIDTMYLTSCNSYLDFILACLIKHRDGKKLRDYASLDVKTYDYDCDFKVDIIDSNLIKDEKLVIKEEDSNSKKIEKKAYDESLTNVPLMLSVSSIKNDKVKFTRKPYFINNSYKKTNIGTLYHRILEVLPVKKYTYDILKEELKNLIKNDEFKLIDINKILAYLNSNVYDLLLKSDKIYKEKEISFMIESSLYDENLKDGQILIDGVIDLMFRYNNIYYIVDYKTDDVGSVNELIKRYKKQLDLYEIGVMSIFNAKDVKKIIYSIKLNEVIEL